MEKIKESKEINLIAMAKAVLRERKALIISITAGTILGLIIAFSAPRAYTADVILAPELSAGGLGLSGNLADMASSFGIDLGSTGKSMDAIYPEIYPEILTSNDFIQSLFSVPVRLKDDNKTRTYLDHIRKDTKIAFWDYPKVWLDKLLQPKDNLGISNGKTDRFKISRFEDKICKLISQSIGCLIDKKTSIITISYTDQDPLVAAIMVDTLQKRLQSYITEYRTKKARIDFNYYSKLYQEARIKYQKAQHIYASFCDSNQDAVLEKYIAKRDELENDMQTAFTLMNQMAVQKQSAQAKIQERTPSYTIIKTAKMPYKASSMSRIMILIITVFFAVMSDVAWILFLRDLLKRKKS